MRVDDGLRAVAATPPLLSSLFRLALRPPNLSLNVLLAAMLRSKTLRRALLASEPDTLRLLLAHCADDVEGALALLASLVAIPEGRAAVADAAAKDPAVLDFIFSSPPVSSDGAVRVEGLKVDILFQLARETSTRAVLVRSPAFCSSCARRASQRSISVSRAAVFALAKALEGAGAASSPFAVALLQLFPSITALTTVTDDTSLRVAAMAVWRLAEHQEGRAAVARELNLLTALLALVRADNPSESGTFALMAFHALVKDPSTRAAVFNSFPLFLDRIAALSNASDKAVQRCLSSILCVLASDSAIRNVVAVSSLAIACLVGLSASNDKSTLRNSVTAIAALSSHEDAKAVLARTGVASMRDVVVKHTLHEGAIVATALTTLRNISSDRAAIEAIKSDAEILLAIETIAVNPPATEPVDDAAEEALLLLTALARDDQIRRSLASSPRLVASVTAGICSGTTQMLISIGLLARLLQEPDVIPLVMGADARVVGVTLGLLEREVRGMREGLKVSSIARSAITVIVQIVSDIWGRSRAASSLGQSVGVVADVLQAAIVGNVLMTDDCVGSALRIVEALASDEATVELVARREQIVAALMSIAPLLHEGPDARAAFSSLVKLSDVDSVRLNMMNNGAFTSHLEQRIYSSDPDIGRDASLLLWNFGASTAHFNSYPIGEQSAGRRPSIALPLAASQLGAQLFSSDPNARRFAAMALVQFTREGDGKRVMQAMKHLIRRVTELANGTDGTVRADCCEILSLVSTVC
jgi:hypothetical protein